MLSDLLMLLQKMNARSGEGLQARTQPHLANKFFHLRTNYTSISFLECVSEINRGVVIH